MDEFFVKRSFAFVLFFRKVTVHVSQAGLRPGRSSTVNCLSAGRPLLWFHFTQSGVSAILSRKRHFRFRSFCLFTNTRQPSNFDPSFVFYNFSALFAAILKMSCQIFELFSTQENTCTHLICQALGQWGVPVVEILWRRGYDLPFFLGNRWCQRIIRSKLGRENSLDIAGERWWNDLSRAVSRYGWMNVSLEYCAGRRSMSRLAHSESFERIWHQETVASIVELSSLIILSSTPEMTLPMSPMNLHGELCQQRVLRRKVPLEAPLVEPDVGLAMCEIDHSAALLSGVEQWRRLHLFCVRVLQKVFRPLQWPALMCH